MSVNLRTLMISASLVLCPLIANAQSGAPAFPGIGAKMTPEDFPLEPIEPAEHDLDLHTVDDSPKMAGFPKGTVLDLMGIELGMTIEEARDAFTGEPAMRNPSRSTVFASNSANGSETELSYPARLESDFIPKGARFGYRAGSDEGTEKVIVYFGTEAIGGRAYRIVRQVVPISTNRISVEAYRKLLIEKYGQPSAMSWDKTGMVWVFDTDRKLDLPSWTRTPASTEFEGQYGMRNAAGELQPECSFSFETYLQDEGLYPQYDYVEDRINPYDRCKGGLEVILYGSEMVEHVTFIAVDHQRALKNAQELDRAIKKKLSTETGPVNSPKL